MDLSFKWPDTFYTNFFESVHLDILLHNIYATICMKGVIYDIISDDSKSRLAFSQCQK